ncbi:MAG: toll/interleukin-1 receptor domain-containing protein [Dehalococcoidia bacterium]
MLKLKPQLVEVKAGASAKPSAEEVAACLFLGSAAGKADKNCVQSAHLAVEAGLPTFPVIEEGDSVQQVLPSALHPFNAVIWRQPGAAEDVILHLLRSLGLTEFQRRVFVSYRRSDSLIIADQLWATLSRRGFQVFLDRFSIDPGVKFQEKLFEALDEKSFVLLVESPEVGTSSWVEEEINYARKRNMGLLVLTWPQTVTSGTTLPGIYEKYRVHVPASAITVDSSGQGRFSPRFLARAVTVVEERHAAALLRRRREIMGSVQSELKRVGINYVGVADWSLVAETKASGKTKRDCVISITPRAPDVPDLLMLDGHATRHNQSDGVLIHTLRSVPEERRGLLEWAIGQRRLLLISEDQIVAFVEDLK